MAAPTGLRASSSTRAASAAASSAQSSGSVAPEGSVALRPGSDRRDPPHSPQGVERTKRMMFGLRPRFRVSSMTGTMPR